MDHAESGPEHWPMGRLFLCALYYLTNEAPQVLQQIIVPSTSDRASFRTASSDSICGLTSIPERSDADAVEEDISELESSDDEDSVYQYTSGCVMHNVRVPSQSDDDSVHTTSHCYRIQSVTESGSRDLAAAALQRISVLINDANACPPRIDRSSLGESESPILHHLQAKSRLFGERLTSLTYSQLHSVVSTRESELRMRRFEQNITKLTCATTFPKFSSIQREHYRTFCRELASITLPRAYVEARGILEQLRSKCRPIDDDDGLSNIDIALCALMFPTGSRSLTSDECASNAGLNSSLSSHKNSFVSMSMRWIHVIILVMSMIAIPLIVAFSWRIYRFDALHNVVEMDARQTSEYIVDTINVLALEHETLLNFAQRESIRKNATVIVDDLETFRTLFSVNSSLSFSTFVDAPLICDVDVISTLTNLIIFWFSCETTREHIALLRNDQLGGVFMCKLPFDSIQQRLDAQIELPSNIFATIQTTSSLPLIVSDVNSLSNKNLRLDNDVKDSNNIWVASSRCNLEVSLLISTKDEFMSLDQLMLITIVIVAMLIVTTLFPLTILYTKTAHPSICLKYRKWDRFYNSKSLIAVLVSLLLLWQISIPCLWRFQSTPQLDYWTKRTTNTILSRVLLWNHYHFEWTSNVAVELMQFDSFSSESIIQSFITPSSQQQKIISGAFIVNFETNSVQGSIAMETTMFKLETDELLCIKLTNTSSNALYAIPSCSWIQSSTSSSIDIIEWQPLHREEFVIPEINVITYRRRNVFIEFKREPFQLTLSYPRSLASPPASGDVNDNYHYFIFESNDAFKLIAASSGGSLSLLRTPISILQSNNRDITLTAQYVIEKFASKLNSFKKWIERPLDEPITVVVKLRSTSWIAVVANAKSLSSFEAHISLSLFAVLFTLGIVYVFVRQLNCGIDTTNSNNNKNNSDVLKLKIVDLTLEELQQKIRPVVIATCGAQWRLQRWKRRDDNEQNTDDDVDVDQKMMNSQFKLFSWSSKQIRRNHHQIRSITTREAVEHLLNRATMHVVDAMQYERNIFKLCLLEVNYPSGIAIAFLRLRTNQAIRVLLYFIAFVHVSLVIVKPSTLNDMRKYGVDSLILIVELICIVFETIDCVRLTSFATLCEYDDVDSAVVKIIRLALKVALSSSLNGFDAINVLLLIAITIDWILQLSIKVSFEYVVPLRAFIIICLHKRIRSSFKTFIVTLQRAIHVLVLYVIVIICSSLIGLLIFPSSIFNSTNSTIQFDSYHGLMRSLLTAFVFLTGENYTSVVYDAYRSNASYLIYFGIVSMIGTFFVLAMVIAIFQDGFRSQQIAQERRREMLSRSGFVAAFTLLDLSGDGLVSWEHVLPLLHRIRPRWTALQLDRDTHLKSWTQCSSRRLLTLEEFCTLLEAARRAPPSIAMPHYSSSASTLSFSSTSLSSSNHSRLQWQLCAILIDERARMFVRAIIIVYASIMSMYRSIDDNANIKLVLALTILGLILIVDVLIRFILLTPRVYWHWAAASTDDQHSRECELEMRFDGILIVLAMLFLLICAFTRDGSEELFRCALALPVLKLFFILQPVRRMLLYIVEALPAFAYVSVLLLMTTYVYAMIGVYLFANRFSEILLLQDQPSGNFDTLSQAMVTQMQLFVGEGWQDIMYAAIRVYDFTAAFYFVSYVVLVTTLLANLLVGMILAVFTVGYLQDVANDRKTTDSQPFSQNAHFGFVKSV